MIFQESFFPVLRVIFTLIYVIIVDTCPYPVWTLMRQEDQRNCDEIILVCNFNRLFRSMLHSNWILAAHRMSFWFMMTGGFSGEQFSKGWMGCSTFISTPSLFRLSRVTEKSDGLLKSIWFFNPLTALARASELVFLTTHSGIAAIPWSSRLNYSREWIYWDWWET
jgi:hypothetical protein